MRLAGSWRASAPAARSMAGQTVATATRGARVAPFAGELEHHVAAHGVAHQGHTLEPEALGEVTNHRTHIGRASGVIERGRKRIGAATVAHVHADDVHAGGPGARSDALDVAGIRRALQTMHQHHCEALGAHGLRLPVAMAQDSAAVRWINLDGLGLGVQAKRRAR